MANPNQAPVFAPESWNDATKDEIYELRSPTAYSFSGKLPNNEEQQHFQLYAIGLKLNYQRSGQGK